MRSAVSSSTPGRVWSLDLEAEFTLTGLFGVFKPCSTPSTKALVCLVASFASFFSSTAATLLSSLIFSVACLASWRVLFVSCWLHLVASAQARIENKVNNLINILGTLSITVRNQLHYLKSQPLPLQFVIARNCAVCTPCRKVRKVRHHGRHAIRRLDENDGFIGVCEEYLVDAVLRPISLLDYRKNGILPISENSSLHAETPLAYYSS